MTCSDIEQLLDAFVDTELSPPQLLDVARHAASCAACDRAIRDLTGLRQSVAALVERESRELDLSGIWPAVDAAIQVSTRSATRVVPFGRRVQAAPLWGALVALAASVFVWLSGPSSELATRMSHEMSSEVATQVASADRHVAATANVSPVRLMRASNDADIDRLSGKDIAVRREPKSGTTIIWVNHLEEER
jgi:anti-sigma factor RsiW